MKKLIITMSLIAAVIAIAGTMHLYHRYLYTPRKNPNPKYFITVKGHISPKLKGISIRWSVDYETSKWDSICRDTTSWIEGASAPKDITSSYMVTSNSKGLYHAKIPLDGYASGYCEWRPINVHYDILSHRYPLHIFGSEVILSNKPQNSNKRTAKNIWFCHKKTETNRMIACDLDGKNISYFNTDNPAYYKQQLNFIVNILAKKTTGDKKK